MTDEVLSHPRFAVHRTITESIVKAIEAGAGEFVMPWHGNGAAIGKPQNAHTKMEYHGVNVIALWAEAYGHGYHSGYWATYRQWQEVGAQVIRGQKGATIVFFKRVEKPEADDEQPARSLIARASRVFNADQVSGWEAPRPSVPSDPVETLESVDTFIGATQARIEHGGARAYYDVREDAIQMPDRQRFIGSPTSSAQEAYSACVLHELVHWSGAKHRLDRGLENGLTKEARAVEELVAEIGAAFLCADLGVTNEPRPDHAAYVASWLQLLKNDVRAIFHAARFANLATTYLHELAAANEW